MNFLLGVKRDLDMTDYTDLIARLRAPVPTVYDCKDAADEIERLRAILDDWVKCAISVEIRDYGQPGYEEAMKALRKARRATYVYERERG
jgi:hypothetical protein